MKKVTDKYFFFVSSFWLILFILSLTVKNQNLSLVLLGAWIIVSAIAPYRILSIEYDKIIVKDYIFFGLHSKIYFTLDIKQLRKVYCEKTRFPFLNRHFIFVYFLGLRNKLGLKSTRLVFFEKGDTSKTANFSYSKYVDTFLKKELQGLYLNN